MTKTPRHRSPYVPAATIRFNCSAVGNSLTAMDPAKGGALLVASFRTCADDFVSKNAELSKGLIVPFELPKKKPKKIEGEDGTDAAAAPAEAVTKS